MPLISKPNYNQIFASQAPEQDKPAVFNNYPGGWGVESRPNNGKPTIKGFNYLQQTSDLKDLWILQNGACLPYDESIEYAEGAPVLKDGVIQYKTASGFKSRDAVTIPTYNNAADGVYPVTGVADGAYFNVRSSNDESYIDEYQNVGGSAVATGKSYLSALGVQQQEKPASTIKDLSGKDQQEVNDDISRRFLDLSDTTIYMKRYQDLVVDGYWDDAIKQGVRDAVQSTFGGIFKLKFPAGIIKVRESSIFTLGLLSGTKRGLVIEGEGKQSTIFYMITRRADNSGNDPKWFYDNGHSNPKFDYVQTMNCSFTSDNKLFGHGFKVWSAGTEKAFLYNNCAFGSSANAAANLDTTAGGLGKGFYFWGTGNADQTDWIACNITTDDDLITLDNNQSVGFNFFGGTCSVYGDAIKVTGNGGGDVNWHGTTMHMLQKADETSMKYMVNIDADLAFGNDRFNFNGIRMELRGNYKGLVNAPRQTGTLNVNFDGAGLVSVGVTSIVTGVIIGASKKVTFNNTNIPERYYYELTSSSTSLNNGGILGFESCYLGVGGSSDVPLYKRIIGAGNGCAYANNCYYNGSGGAVNFKVTDFYLGGNANARMPSRKLKAVNLKRSATSFPNAAGASGEWSTEFPVGTLIKSITVIKPAVSGGSSGTYQLHVGNNDKSKTYGSSEELPFSSEHRVTIDVNLLVSNETDAIVRVWATGSATNNVSGGVALVEYY